MTDTAQAVAVATVTTSPVWWHIIVAALLGWLVPKAAQRVTPAQVATVETVVAPIAETALTVTGHPETAALVDRVVETAQAAGAARAALAANPQNSAEQAQHQAASVELVNAALAVSQAPK